MGTLLRWVSDSKVATQVLEVTIGQGLGKNIHGVVLRVHVCECNGAILHKIADVVELDPDVFHIRVADMILCQLMSGIVVT